MAPALEFSQLMNAPDVGHLQRLRHTGIERQRRKPEFPTSAASILLEQFRDL
jgi:hypothetical protein